MVSHSSDGVSRSIPWRSNVIHVIVASSLIGVMGITLISPVLPALRTAFGISDAQVGLVITVYTLPGIVVTPFIGLVADRIGRRRVIIPLLFLFGISGGAIAFSESFTQVLVLRFFQGIGATALITLAITLIGDFYDGQQRNDVMGLNASVIGSGAALYPLIGGVLGAVAWNIPFLFFAVAIGVGLYALFVLPEPESTAPTDVRTYLRRLRDVAMLPEAIAIFVTVFGLFFVFYGAVQTALPLLLNDEFDLSSLQIGIVLAMVSVSSATVSLQYGRIASYRSAQELVALGIGASGLSLLGIWLSPSPLFVGISLIGFGIGFGIAMPSIDTTTVTLVSEQLRAGTMGMRTSMLRFGETVGPMVFTIYAETMYDVPADGYRMLILVFGIVLVTTGFVSYRVLR